MTYRFAALGPVRACRDCRADRRRHVGGQRRPHHADRLTRARMATMTTKPDLYRAIILGLSGFATTALLMYVDAVSAVIA